MNTARRNLLTGLTALPLATLLAGEGSAEAKPLTTAGLARTLLGMADKAKAQGLVSEAKALRACALELLKGEQHAGIVPCDTDIDCERKNPKLGKY